MDFLIIDGTPYDVVVGRAAANETERIGRTFRAFSGGMRTSVRVEKGSWSFGLAPMAVAEVEAFRNNLLLKGFLPCEGQAIRGGTRALLCEVRITKEEFVEDESLPDGFQVLLDLQLTEV